MRDRARHRSTPAHDAGGDLACSRSFGWLERGLVWMAGIGLLSLSLAHGFVAPLDHALYDWHMRHWQYQPDNAVVIVAIDAKSLHELGRWPWPRALHAKLIKRLDADGVRGIGMDITLANPDAAHPQNDRALAQAIRESGDVVLPVFAEPGHLGGPLEEMLPIPAFTRNVAALGHVDVARGADGVTRGAYLMAGLGRAYWPSLALALYRLDKPAGARAATLPGLRNPASGAASPYLWVRDHYVLLHYAGPAGSFGRVSYVDVLEGRVPASLLRGREVLVGATAEGLGDIIDTSDGPMPGVEYQANMFESLRRGNLVTPLGFTAQLVVGAVMLALPCLLLGLPGLRRGWRAALVGVVLTLALAVGLLRLAGYWWPPTSCLLIMVVGAVAWSLQARLSRVPAVSHDRKMTTSWV